MKPIILLSFCAILSVSFAYKEKDLIPKEVALALKSLPAEIDFNIHVKPILSDKCFACHGPDKAKQKAGLRLDLPEGAFSGLPESPGKFAIVPRNLAKSEMVKRILSIDPSYKMPLPKSHLELSTKEKAVLIKWIQNGAEYKTHWAFVSPIKKEIPAFAAEKNPIDYFISKKLAFENLKLSESASRNFLLRRLSFDLTGLPPTVDEIEFFKNDIRSNAYEYQVDRLLSSPHFGEKLAAEWLDLARFADSHGYTIDRIRDMSPYRDWVIQAFNKNLPYDQFIQQQLAGDLMPSPTKNMRIATAFNRNHQQNTEGGIVEEEFQTEYVMDRANTFGDTFLALTTGCARCHDHKYDPISQKNYYQLFSFFNNVKEAGQISYNDDMPTPTMLLPTDKQQAIMEFIQSNIKTTEEKLVQLKPMGFELWAKGSGPVLLKKEIIPQNGLLAYYDFESSLANTKNAKEIGILKHESGKTGDTPQYQEGHSGKGLAFDGDVYCDFDRVGVFRKSDPFSIGIWVNVPKNLKEGVIFHKSNAERLYNFKGFHVYLKNNSLEVMMAHSAPSNAITKITKSDIPRDRWVQLTLSYDGSSTAKGLKLYMDGSEPAMETTMDQLYKDIIFYSKQEPGLQIGAWWRGLGFKGGRVDDILVYNRELRPYEVKLLANKASSELVFGNTENLLDFYSTTIDSVHLKVKSELGHWRKTFSDSTEAIQELMVMQEMPKPKKAHVLLRGQYDAPSEEVFPNTPEKIFPFASNLPKNRLGLAMWLTDSQNPLTSRVAVNRIWQNLFGIGIVKTAEDFGNQGEMPFHPELLDWLAVNFRESGWDVKKLIKLLVMSKTYQQGSKASRELMERDPENRLLARGPSARLTAEMIRDNALVASELINREIGGKSMYPYQPEGLWEINSHIYKQDTTQAIYRRSLYVIVKRSVPNPTMSTFDATSRSSCLVRRQKTNTPLQALVVLNDPTFVEASKLMGLRMSKQNNVSLSIKDAYLRLTGRDPQESEINILLELQKKEWLKFQKMPDKTKGWLSMGMSRLDQNLIDRSFVASLAVVANTIMNSDATITKR
jgi:hypothetical protein